MAHFFSIHVGLSLYPEGKMVLYDIMDNRWCENIGRAHKSNNIMYVVSASDSQSLQFACKYQTLVLIVYVKTTCMHVAKSA